MCVISCTIRRRYGIIAQEILNATACSVVFLGVGMLFSILNDVSLRVNVWTIVVAITVGMYYVAS
jgi:hypothetical protein